jgi:hypothetical protein
VTETLTLLQDDMLAWLLFKPRVRIVGARCTNRRFGDHGGLEGYPQDDTDEMTRCPRPQWGDGKGIGPNGFGGGLCSRCFHEYMAFHGDYTTLTANPAASLLSGEKIAAMSDLFGGERRLPEVGAERPDTFPEDWL